MAHPVILTFICVRGLCFPVNKLHKLLICALELMMNDECAQINRLTDHNIKMC